MAKNRKNQSAAVRFGPALKAFVLCVVFGGAAVGYVWQKSQIDELGRQIKQRELRLLELNNQNKKLSGQLATLCSPAELNARVLKLNLGLAQPLPNQVYSLPEPVLSPPASVNPPARAIAASSGTGLVMQ